MKKQCSELVRLRRVILNDNLRIPHGVVEILRKDLCKVLSGYFDIDEGSLQIEINVGEDGVYYLDITAKGNSVKTVKNL